MRVIIRVLLALGWGAPTVAMAALTPCAEAPGVEVPVVSLEVVAHFVRVHVHDPPRDAVLCFEPEGAGYRIAVLGKSRRRLPGAQMLVGDLHHGLGEPGDTVTLRAGDHRAELRVPASRETWLTRRTSAETVARQRETVPTASDESLRVMGCGHLPRTQEVIVTSAELAGDGLRLTVWDPVPDVAARWVVCWNQRIMTSRPPQVAVWVVRMDDAASALAESRVLTVSAGALTDLVGGASDRLGVRWLGLDGVVWVDRPMAAEGPAAK